MTPGADSSRSGTSPKREQGSGDEIPSLALRASVADPAPECPGVREAWARVATQIAAVAGVFLVVAAALLAWDYSRRLAKDPLESAEFKGLKTELAAQPQNEALMTEVRELDRVLRAQYFEQRQFAAWGAWILLGGAAVLVIALRTAATLRRRLPQPEARAVPIDSDTHTEREARWAVAGIAGVLAVAGIGLALGVGTVVNSDLTSPVAATTGNGSGGDETASNSPASVRPDGTKTAAAPAPSASAPVASGSAASTGESARYWPRFRGPSGLGISAYTNVPTTWDGPAGKNIVWKTAVPLEGNSSPIVWKDRIFITSAIDGMKRVVLCTRSQMMRRLFALRDEPVSVTSTMASASLGGFTSVAPQENSTCAVTP